MPHKRRDGRYPELSHARQVLRANRKTQIPAHNWHEASHSVERLRAWQHIVRLAATHQLELSAVGRYMSTPEQWRVLEARFVERPVPSYAVLGRRLKCTIEAVESVESRALLRVLTRMIAYDLSVRGEPDGLMGQYSKAWD
jgi:hypothetical protein